MLSLEESLKILKETNALLEGHFILSSGLHSSQYVQCAQLLSKPDKARLICKSLSEKIQNSFKDFDIILSPAIGGIVIGYEIGRLLNKETIFLERVNGEFQLRRDFTIKKKQKVLIIEYEWNYRTVNPYMNCCLEGRSYQEQGSYLIDGPGFGGQTY